MQPVLYTDTDKIRAALGLTDKEVRDVQITDASVALQLTVDLRDVYPNHADLHARATSGSATEDDKYLNTVLTLYCQYQCCIYLLAAIQMIAVQKISDGDFDMGRFQSGNLQDTIDRITALRDKYRAVLVSAAFPGPTRILSHLAVAAPSYDPVTNEGG